MILSLPGSPDVISGSVRRYCRRERVPQEACPVSESYQNVLLTMGWRSAISVAGSRELPVENGPAKTCPRWRAWAWHPMNYPVRATQIRPSYLVDWWAAGAARWFTFFL